MAKTPLMTAMKHGFAGCCPECGKGKLYRRYLKVVDECAACGLELARYPADDGPAYLTILLVGHLVIAPLLFFRQVWDSNPWVVVPLSLAGLMALVLIVLPYIKGAFIGLLYHLNITRQDARLHTADRAD
ncbi:MAG: DUF983 domain-containing protein [Caulobacteraceae bacterium]